MNVVILSNKLNQIAETEHLHYFHVIMAKYLHSSADEALLFLLNRKDYKATYKKVKFGVREESPFYPPASKMVN